ncbi:sodium- and chloride-dependent GABA transporter ine-like [Penaeus monodon]|uniref:sodium- and chloride-dependent GABA transporter ine-like n=1 Tax=Penaeus monodon TaxID=6687 RepID=UPI0018A74B77|nr:sodium- and chloride-dependent GABA transporter ine-like [Penaeus monodon]
MCQVPVGNSKGKDEQCGHEGEARREVSSTTTATSHPEEKTNREEKETLLELESQKDERSGTKEDAQARLNWANKLQFVLACIGYSVGLGNLWRFPYLCYKSGGGAFLIPYFTMLFVCGIPLLLMELTVGQFTRRGPVGALAKLCPLLKGAGVGTVVMSFLVGTYYNIIIAWSIFYMIQSFTEDLPWKNCNATWAVACFDDYGANVTAPNDSKSATEEFFDEVVLQRSTGIEAMGSVRLELVLALVAAWILVYFCIWKSIKSSGKVVYVTATVPYLLIGAFLWRALTLPGANNGLQYFFKPQWELLLDAQVWVSAAAQNFNSIGIAFGSLIAFASYNKLDNNIVLDTWAICLTNSFTSLLSGMIVFSTLGNIALEQGKDIDDVVAQGPGLVFTVYPQALAKMPYAAAWSVLFFFMLLIFGLDSQFANVEVIITSLQDEFPKWIKKHLKHHEFLVMIVCFVSFICGLPNVTEGGIYFFQLIDYYAASVSLMYVAFFEIIAVVWIYGAGRLAENLKEMTGKLPSFYFRCCWYFAAPVLIFAIWIFSLVDYKNPTYDKGKYKYPDWAIGTGWIIASLSILPTPILAVVEITRAKGSTLWEKIRSATQPKIEQCSCCARTHSCLNEDYFLKEEVREQMKLVACDYPLSENRGTVAPNQENGIHITETYDRLV